jgi:RNA polymerase sigma-70 factor (ECF subfamily)
LGHSREAAFVFLEPFRPRGAILNSVDNRTDAALVEAMRRGDEASFVRLYAAHHASIYRYAVRMCGAAAADDVVQETFTALLRGERFDPRRGTLSAYLFGVARHCIFRRLSAADLESALEDEPLDERTPFDEVSRAETVGAVRAAIDTLPPLYREAIVLCELQ